MIGEIKIFDKDGKCIGVVKPEMMPLKFDVETSFGGKNFKLSYSYPRTDGWRDKKETKGIVLN